MGARARWVPAAVAVATVVVAGGAWVGTAAAHRDGPGWFDRTATYPVYLNRPAGEDPATPTVAEISAVSLDGRTVLYTDALARRLGFVDISDPGHPRGLGTLSLAELGDAEDEPTSVAVHGRYALVVVNTSASFTAPSGRLDVIELATRTRVRSIDLGGQPDSIAVGRDGRYAVIAIENERDEDATPPGGEEGDLPQAPAGFLQIVDLRGKNPAGWSTRSVALTNPDGSALPALTVPGIAAPEDPEPEYVSLNARNVAAVTLQENNGIVLVDVPTGRIMRAFSAGTTDLSQVDIDDDGAIDPSGTLTDVPREPDAVAWLDNRYLATANEGDWRGGSRGWSILDSRTGTVAWDSGNSLEWQAIRYGLHNEGRADNKGTEPEGVAVAEYGGHRYAFVGSERSNFVAVYEVDDATRPKFRQILPTTNGPEGILPVPSRNLLVVSSEVDEPAVRVRASLSVFRLSHHEPSFPTLVSERGDGPAPIGWGALSGLSAVPGRPQALYAVTDSAYSPTRVLTVNVRRRPAAITGELTVTDAQGQPVGYDAEGVAARRAGGFWLAVEGSTGAANKLVRLDPAGRTVEVVPLPADVAAGLGGQGLEGVTLTYAGRDEYVWVAVQREVKTDPKGTVRIGRYDVTAGTWAWWGYQLETTTTAGDWIGLSEITAVGSRLAIIERDKLNGPDARIKRVYTVDIPTTVPAAGTLPVLPKRLKYDLLPALRAGNGWTQEKLEGFTVAGDGKAYAVTDNDGVDDATGETVLIRLG